MSSRRSEPAYPFVPKSTASLRPGQLWAVPLRDGRFACGRVLEVHDPRQDPRIPSSDRIFLAGLLDWSGDTEPTAETIAGAGLVAQGNAHIKAITTTGGAIVGIRPLELDGLRPILWLSAQVVYEGWSPVRPASDEDLESLPVMGTWGFRFIRALADKRFAA